MVIEEANPPFEMRRVVVPLVQQYKQVEQAIAQPLNLPLVPSTQERLMVERIETKTAVATPERSEPEKDLAPVTDNVVPDPMAAPPTTPMPNPAFATTS